MAPNTHFGNVREESQKVLKRGRWKAGWRTILQYSLAETGLMLGSITQLRVQPGPQRIPATTVSTHGGHCSTDEQLGCFSTEKQYGTTCGWGRASIAAVLQSMATLQ